MEASNSALALIKESESLQLTKYSDANGFATIGYGHRIKPGESYDTITEAQANDLLASDVKIAENCINTYVKVTLNQNQFDALVDFVYNVGCYKFKLSTICKELNKGDYTQAAAQFTLWVHGGSQVLPGLVTRRQKEEQLFSTP